MKQDNVWWLLLANSRTGRSNGGSRTGVIFLQTCVCSPCSCRADLWACPSCSANANFSSSSDFVAVFSWRWEGFVFSTWTLKKKCHSSSWYLLCDAGETSLQACDAVFIPVSSVVSFKVAASIKMKLFKCCDASWVTSDGAFSDLWPFHLPEQRSRACFPFHC